MPKTETMPLMPILGSDEGGSPKLLAQKSGRQELKSHGYSPSLFYTPEHSLKPLQKDQGPRPPALDKNVAFPMNVDKNLRVYLHYRMMEHKNVGIIPFPDPDKVDEEADAIPTLFLPRRISKQNTLASHAA